MKRKIIITLCVAGAFALLTACSTPSNTNTPANTSSNANVIMNSNMTSNSEGNPVVGDSPMSKEKDIFDNASNSKDHTRLVALIKASGLVETLKGAGPFTVFAPTNASFDKLSTETIEALTTIENADNLVKGILTYHVIAGKQDAASIAKAIETGNGTATFTTVQGGTLTASLEGKDVVLTDEKGGKSKVTLADVMQSNGVMHVVDSVLMPK